CETPSFPRRPRDARIDVPSRSGIDRLFGLSFASSASYAHGGSHGKCPSDRPQSASGASRPGKESSVCSRRGAGPDGRLCGCGEIREVIMASVDVKNLNNEVVGKLDLADAVFAGPINEGLMHLAVKQYLASQRSGTHKTK